MSLPTAPRTGQAAIDAALARVGGTMPEGSGYCLKFTRDQYQVPSRYASAIDAWNAATEQHPDDRNPPPSASVWFYTPSIYRHVAFHVGGGQVVSTFNDEIRSFPSLAAVESSFGGPYMGWAPELNDYSLRPATTPPPPDPTPEDDDMIMISAPGRGIALVGPGYYKWLANDEEVQLAGSLVTKTLSGSDRQFDVWVAICTQGVAAYPGSA